MSEDKAAGLGKLTWAGLGVIYLHLENEAVSAHSSWPSHFNLGMVSNQYGSICPRSGWCKTGGRRQIC